jgi:Rad3-related DNA helicase
MPYNYLLDANILARHANIIENSIIIFDEAHNVADAACEGRSFDAKLSMFKGFYS